MSPLTVFLGKLIGLYCIIAALALMTHKQSTVASVKALIRNPPLLLLVEVIALIAGLAMVLGHEIWSGGALAVIVTLIGWLMTIRGVVLLALSEDVKLKLFDALRYEERFFVYMGVVLVLGIYLTFAAFSA
jgi:hypothetical protein